MTEVGKIAQLTTTGKPQGIPAPKGNSTFLKVALGDARAKLAALEEKDTGGKISNSVSYMRGFVGGLSLALGEEV